MRARHALLVALAVALLAACSEPPPTLVYQAIPVERRNIIVSVEAAGTVEPHVTVEVKSKASGEILEMRVETGDLVTQGALMVRIDQRQPRNSLAAAEAELDVALAGLANAKSQRRRAEELFKAESMSATEYDDVILSHAYAKADVVRGRVAMENSRIALADTEVRAPIAGTIIEKNVERGQVISSPTRDVAGGTILLTMADLNRVRIRTWVDETDIGKIHPGLPATVVAAAYPHRPFGGEVLKIEPQAVTEQNVTTFPVLVGVENPGGDLKPWMNCEVEIHVGSREEVLAVPNAALRTQRDVGSAAQVLGLSEEEVQRALAPAAVAARTPTESSAAAMSSRPVSTPTPETPETPENGSGGDGSASHAPGGEVRRGTSYIVFVLLDGQPTPTRILTGLTDLDYSEVLEGLSESDSVLILPSAGLVRSQERFRERVSQRGGMPGLKSRPGR